MASRYRSWVNRGGAVPAMTPARRASSSRPSTAASSAGRGAVGQQADVDVAAGHGRPLQQPDAFRGQPGQPAPQRLGDAGRDLGGLVPRALGDQQPGQLPDEERVAAAALPQLGGDLRAEASSRPASSAIAPTSAGSRPARASCWAWPATSRSSGDASVSRYAPSSSTAPPPGRGPGSPAAAATARRPSAGRRAPPARAGRRPGGPGTATTASNKRNWASRRGGGARRLRLAGAACSSQPASPSSAAGKPVARSTCDHGQYGGAPSPSQQNPRRTRASRPGLVDQRGQHRRLADAGLAADHQELPGAAAGIVEHRTGGGQRGLPADEPVGSTHGFIMAGQGRSSKTRFIGAGTPSLRTRPNPASAARARSRCSPA